MSPCYIKRLTSAGLQDVDYQANSLAEAVQYEPANGIYTVTNTFNTFKTLKFEAHLDRLEDSAQRAGITLNLDRLQLKQALRQMIADANYGDVRFRVTVSQNASDTFIISLEPFTPLSKSFKDKGVRCITAKNSARHNAAAKTTDWMHTRKGLQQAMPDGIYDTILLDKNGQMLEGLGSNFYAILNNELRTADKHILLGIAQQIVFEVAPNIIPLNHQAVHIDNIPQLSEAFITSSSRGIVPVVEIDGIPIGTGDVGEITQSLIQAYDQWVTEHLEDL